MAENPKPAESAPKQTAPKPPEPTRPDPSISEKRGAREAAATKPR